MEDLKNDGETSRPEQNKDQTLGPTVNDKLKEIEFDDVNIITKTLHSTKEERKSFTTNNTAKHSKNNETSMVYERAFFENPNNFITTLLIDLTFTRQNQSPSFVNFEIPAS